jgi:hypothetical protein
MLAVKATSGTSNRAYVLKRTSPQEDWVMVASEDHRCRPVTLWQYGLLDKLQPDIDHTIVACARDGNGWAILMRDMTSTLVAPTLLNETIILALLDGLASIHARFWQTSALAEPALGLCDSAGLLATLSPQTIEGIPDPSWPPREWITTGWSILQEMLTPEAADLLTQLMDDPSPLITALARYPITLLHGDYGGNNVGLTGLKQLPVIALDWQMAGYSVPTIDLAWFLYKVEVRAASISTEAAVAYYRQRLAHRLGNRFNGDWWEPMWALGQLVHILRAGSMTAWSSKNAPTETTQSERQATVAQYQERIRAAVEWL